MGVSRRKQTGKSNGGVPPVSAVDAPTTRISSQSKATLFGIEVISFYLLLSAMVGILLFLRRPGELLFPTLYFEDGAVFYRDQLLSASAATVFKPFSMGYYVLVPRLVSLVAWLAPATMAPYIFNLAGLSIGATATSFFCLPQFRNIVASDGLRVALCLLFAGSLDSTEALASASNCFWLLGIPVILLAATPPLYL